jgi:PAS domain S-box-containing protein
MDSKQVTWSPELFRIFGLTPEDGPPSPEERRKIYPPESMERLEAAVARCLETGESFRISLEANRPDGAVLSIEAHGALLRDQTARSALVHGVVLDRTEERRARAALEASEAQFASAFEYAVIGKALVSPDGRWLKVNRAMCEMLGYTEAELMRMTFQEITHPDDLEADLKLVEEMLANKRQTYQIEKRYFHRSRRIVWALLSVSLVRDAAGRPLNFISQVQDITARKQAEAERQHLFEFSLDLLCISGLDGYLRQVNPAWTRVLGWSEDELLSRPVFTFLHPDDLEATEAGRAGLMTGRPLQDLENRYRCKDGSYRWLSWRSFSRPEEGVVFAIARDITDRKQAEAALRQTSDRLLLATRVARLGIWEWNVVENFTVWDDAMHEIYGLPPGTVVDGFKEWERFLHPDDSLRMHELVDAVLAGPAELDSEFRIVTPGGQVRHIKVNALVQRAVDGQPLRMIGTNLDITEQRESEEHLRALAHRLQLAKDLAGVGVFDYEVRTDTLLWDERLHEIYGTNPENEDEEPGIERWRSRVHPEDLPLAEAACFGIMVDPHGGSDISYRIRRASDGALRHLRSVAKVERDAVLHPIRVIGMNLDVTEEIELQEHLRRAGQAAEAASRAKSEFLAMMSHEIRTPMNAVIGYGDLLRLTALAPEQADMVDNIQRGGANLLEIIEGILDFSKIEAGKLTLRFEPLDLQVLIADVCDLLAVTAQTQGLRFEQVLAPDLPERLVGDSQAIKRILTNLLGNAIKFTETGFVRLAASRKDVAGEPFLRLEVTDSGIGLTAETLERIFRPFSQGDSSNKRRFGGTGLGLVISRRLAEAMGGSLTAGARAGGGAVFVFSLPIRSVWEIPDPHNPLPVVRTSSTASVSPDLRILLVEDNPVNRQLMTRLIQRLGCTSTAVADGREALHALALTAYDVVLMDLQMPVMDGWEAAVEIRRRESADPSIPRSYLIAQSASAMEEDARRCREIGMDDHLSKPVTLQSLAAALARAPASRRKAT